MPHVSRPTRRAVLAAALGAPLTAGALQGCASGQAADAPVRIGYFANVTHGVPTVAAARGTFTDHLGGRGIDAQIFASGPAAVQAMLAGALDVAYVGPNPALTAWVRTKGRGVRLLAGAAQNGASLVARPGITSLEGLRGHSVSTPQLGGTQDVALKHLLREKNIPLGGGSDQVEVLWMANSQTLDQFRQGRLDASYQAEPWVSRLVEEAGAHVLVDETSLWPQHRFSTTSVIVSADFLKNHRDRVEAVMAAHVAATQWINAHRDEARAVINGEIKRLTGKKLKSAVMARAMKSVRFDVDPMLGNLDQVGAHTFEVGGIDVRPDLHGFADLGPLNKALAAARLPQADDEGYGTS